MSQLAPPFPIQIDRPSLAQPVGRVVILLLATDVVFILLHLVHIYTPWANDPNFLVSQDRGFGEVYQYVKLSWIAGYLLLLAAQHRAWVLIGWAVLFLYALIDDGLHLHEQAGQWVAETFAPPAMFGLRPVDFGEVALAAGVGLLLLALIAALHVVSPAWSWRLSRQLLAFLAALAFFGIVLDLIHVMLALPHTLAVTFSALEDGGEMLVVSLTLAWILSRDHAMTTNPAKDAHLDKDVTPAA